MEEQFQQKRLNYNTRRRASETEEEIKEILKKRKEMDPREKSATTSAKVAG